ncbi:TniQ family protein [Kitasatospora sp. NPDC004799]|uniref:TniQ family protein n=1 Tax=Kitasatospora sp. NPDC004799 TaxID=3154460 RepID=UPI0033A76766
MPELPDPADLRPLPKSLDPLEGEALSGYLRRLGFRLGLQPSQVVVRTGLSERQPNGKFTWRIPGSRAFALDNGRREVFAHTTRLSLEEVDGLLLVSLQHRYGPLSPRYLIRTIPGRLRYNNPWVLTDRVQYCPQCLAGDGSQIQDLYGGPWLRNWHLPPIFLCLQHQRLLRRQCHVCGELPHAANWQTLLARPRDETLHPTQCRGSGPVVNLRGNRPACGADLTKVAPGLDALPADSRSRNALISLQERFLSLLAPEGPEQVGSVGWLVPTAQYFMDLKAVAAMILMSWPEARPHAPSQALAKVIDLEAGHRHEQFLELREAPRSRARIFTTPPDDSLTTAAILTIADKFLQARDEVEAATYLRPLVDEAAAINHAVSYPLRRQVGTSFPLQVVLGGHRQALGQATQEEVIERHSDSLSRAPQ